GGRWDLGEGVREIRVWESASGRCLRALAGHAGGVSDLDVTPDGRLAFSCSDDRTLRVWDVLSGRCLRELEGTAGLSYVRVTASGRLAITGGQDGLVQVWDVEADPDEQPSGTQASKAAATTD